MPLPPLKRWTAPASPLLCILSHRAAGYHQPPARHEEHEIHVILGGGGRYRLGDSPAVEVVSGELLVIPAGVCHAIDVPRRMDLAAIHIHPRAFDALEVADGAAAEAAARLRGWSPPAPWRRVLAPDSFATLARLAEDAAAEHNRPQEASAALLDAMAAQAAILMLRLMLLEHSPRDDDPAARQISIVRAWIDRHYAEDCRLERLARMARLAPTYFAGRFRALVGTPPLRYVRQRRLEQARLLLQHTSQPVKAIAAQVGWTDVSHFNRLFRQASGMTPLAWRRRSPRVTRDCDPHGTT